MRLRKEWVWMSFLLVVIGLLTLPVGKNNCDGILQAKAADEDAIVAEGECGEKLTYRVQRMTTSSWELVIEGDGKMDDYTEAAKAPWYYYRNSITKITTPVGLDSIGDYAFYDMQKVTEISLTRGITRIGDYAFYRCMSWDPGTGDFLPDYLNIIEDGAFVACSKITTIYIPAGVKTIGKRAFASMNGLTTIHFPTGNFQMELGEQLFASSRVLTTVTLPENIETITNRMFYECTALETITLPETITEIAEGAFYDCQSLKEIEIPEGVEEIAAITFGRNIHLAKVTLPDNLYRIGYEAFDRCLYLTEIDIPDSVEWIEEGAFSDTGLETIKMPANLRGVSSSCFNGCKKLTSVQLNDNLSSIDQSAFDITGLSEISISINVRTIGQRAFGCNMSGTVEGFIVYGHSDVAKEYAEKFDLTYEAKHELVTDESEIETVVKGAVAATTTKKGYTGDTYCKQCDQLIARGTEIPVKTTSGSSGTGSNNPTNTENQSSASNTTTNASVAVVKSLKAVAAKKALKLSWKKVTGANGYEIQYALKSNYKNARKLTVKSNQKTIKKLKAKKKYYIRVRAYKTNKDAFGKTVKVYSKWTKVSKKTK